VRIAARGAWTDVRVVNRRVADIVAPGAAWTRSQPTTGARSVTPEDPLMAITLGRRRRSRSEPAATRPFDDAAQSERAAMTALAETLRFLAAGLPRDSPLAAEFASVARSIDVAGVVGAWGLQRLAGEHAD
jgi:hypothetical protein